jgi:predicted DsbA family dithiol-disulfide isomerase
MTAPNTATLRLQVVSDIICPWCFIGKRALDQALDILAKRGAAIEIEWLPYQLNPALAAQGMDRKAFRSARFGGWENALAMDARAIEAGGKVGAEFRYDRQTRTPNTLAAHALARLALVEGGPVLQAQVMEALFAGYFTHGEDVGDPAVLARIAGGCGMGADAAGRSVALRDEARLLDEAARAAGLNGVPSYLIDGKLLFSGSRSVDGYVQVLAEASGLS